MSFNSMKIIFASLALVGIIALALSQSSDYNDESDNSSSETERSSDNSARPEVYERTPTQSGNTQSAAEVQKSHRMIEMQTINQYVSVTGTYTENIIGNGFQLDGAVINKATLYGIRGVSLIVDFYDKNGANLGSHNYNVESATAPQGYSNFKLKIPGAPKRSKSIGWRVSGVLHHEHGDGY